MGSGVASVSWSRSLTRLLSLLACSVMLLAQAESLVTTTRSIRRSNNQRTVGNNYHQPHQQKRQQQRQQPCHPPRSAFVVASTAGYNREDGRHGPRAGEGAGENTEGRSLDRSVGVGGGDTAAAAAAVDAYVPHPILLDPTALDANRTPNLLLTPPIVARRSAVQNSNSPLLLPRSAAEHQQRRHRSGAAERVAARHRSVFVGAVAALAGGGNILSLRTYGCFVNMCTGATVRVAVALASGKGFAETALPSAVIVGYALGVALARVAKHTVQRSRDECADALTETTIAESTAAAAESASAAATTTTATANVVSAPASHRLGVHKVVRRFLLPAAPKKALTLDVLVAVAPMIVVLFGAADVLTHLRAAPAWHAAAQAVAYGLVHQAASDATGGAVLFVVTGYYSGIVRSAVDGYMVAPTKQLWATIAANAQMAGSFFASVFCTVAVLNRVAPRLPSLPVHTLTGLVYAIVFLWYGNAGGAVKAE